MNAKKTHSGDAFFSHYVHNRLKQVFKGKPSRQLELECKVEEEDI